VSSPVPNAASTTLPTAVPVVPDIPKEVPADDEVMVSLYASRKKIHPRSVFGLFSKWRWVLVWLTQIVFYGLPWLEWNARQAVLFDLEARRFYIFGLVLYPQDFIYLTGLLVISALALFLFTAVAGRLWCGYACPQTVYTEIFLWIEKKVEGDRSARMRLDESGSTRAKVGKKTLKHALWVVFGLWTGFTFVGYFTPIRELAVRRQRCGAGPLANLLDPLLRLRHLRQRRLHARAGLQVHVPLRPLPERHVRQGHDDRDLRRGTGRAPRRAFQERPIPGPGTGRLCRLHAVCAGLPHRHRHSQGPAVRVHRLWGLRRRVRRGDGQGGLPPGTGQVLDAERHGQRLDPDQMIRHALRPRVLVYTGILLAITLAVIVSLYLRTPLKVDVIRDRGALARMVEQGRIENVFRFRS
jgi:hypothetical protein